MGEKLKQVIREKSVVIPVNREFPILIPVNRARHPPPPLSTLICGVAKQTGERYPPKTLYLLVCGINRHLGNVQGKKALTYWRKVSGGKTTFFEAIFHLYQKIMNTN